MTERELDIAHSIGHDVPGYINGDFPPGEFVRYRMLAMVQKIAELDTQVAQMREERDAFVERAVASWRKEVDAMREERDKEAHDAYQFANDLEVAELIISKLREERDALAVIISREHGAVYVDKPYMARILATRDARMKAEGAAEELEKMADRWSRVFEVGKDLRDRAAAIRKEAGL